MLNAPLETKPRVLHLKKQPASGVRIVSTADIDFLFSIPPHHNMSIVRLSAKRAPSTYFTSSGISGGRLNGFDRRTLIVEWGDENYENPVSRSAYYTHTHYAGCFSYEEHE